MRLLSIVVVITCLLALTLPVVAQDGAPPPWCKPGTQCCDAPSPGGAVVNLDGTLSNKPCCYACERGQKTFGEINKDRTIAQFMVSPLVAAEMPNTPSLSAKKE